MVGAADRRAAPRHRRDLLEDVALRDPIELVHARHRARTWTRGPALANLDEAVGVLVGERPEEDGVDDAEDRGVGADANRDGQNGDGAGERSLSDQPERVPEI